MNNKTNYTLVGAFVLLGFIAITVFVYWLIRPGDENEMKKYVIYFNESVQGLNLDAPVKYRGISVGKVIRLGINPKNTEQVRVLIKIDKATPITTSTVAKLTSQGITGLSYINLTLKEKNAPLLTTIPPGEKYPVIKSVPSLFESVQTSMGNLYKQVFTTLKHIDQTLSEENQKRFSQLLFSSSEFFTRINTALNEQTIRHIQKSAEHIENITAKLDKTMQKVNSLIDTTQSWEQGTDKSLADIAESYKSVQKTSDSLDKAIQRGDFNLQDISNRLTSTLNRSLYNLNNVLNNLKSMLQEYKQNPSDILFKETQKKKAPGEK